MKIIGIAGLSASGKTTLAKSLREKYPDKIDVISLDNYFKDFSKSNRKEKKLPNLDTPDAIEFELLITHLLELKENKRILAPKYNFHTYERQPDFLLIEPKPILILEGFLIFQNQSLLNMLDRKIFIDTDAMLCLIRRLQREMQNHRDVAAALEYFQDHAYPCYLQYVQPAQKFADKVLKNENLSALFLEIEEEVLQIFCD